MASAPLAKTEHTAAVCDGGVLKDGGVLGRKRGATNHPTVKPACNGGGQLGRYDSSV